MVHCYNLKGYVTIQIRESLQNKLKEAYELKKVDLFAKENIKSYSAYAQKLLERAIDQDILKGRFEIRNRFENTVTVRDYYRVKDADVTLKEGKVFCELDRSADCDHVGFVLSDPEIIKRAQQLGVKLRRRK